LSKQIGHSKSLNSPCWNRQTQTCSSAWRSQLFWNRTSDLTSLSRSAQQFILPLWNGYLSCSYYGSM